MGQKMLAEIDDDAFLKHLDDASEMVRSWEPWKRAILGRKSNETVENGASTRSEKSRDDQASSNPEKKNRT